MIKIRYSIFFIFTGVITLFLGCQKKEVPPATQESFSVNDSASIDPKSQKLDNLYTQSLKGDKESIRSLINQFKDADGEYGEAIQYYIPQLLMNQTKSTMEVLDEITLKERKDILWMCIASESASPPKNLLATVSEYKNDNPKIYQEIKNTIDVRAEYIRLYKTQGESAAANYVKQYYDEK